MENRVIYVVKTPQGHIHPAVIIHPKLALPLYTQPWGTHSLLAEWIQSGLNAPSYIVLSQPWRLFSKRKHLGALQFTDQVRLFKVAASTPALLQEIRNSL